MRDGISYWEAEWPAAAGAAAGAGATAVSQERYKFLF
jgi:hypothetical protein